MINLKEIRDWIDTLPEEFLEFNVMNAEECTSINNISTYKFDRPISSLNVNKENKEVLFINKKIKKN
tara:strand:+ start:1917 stop:2117 length:201 start_codon:yes stop_codon:yes gene_type:complete